MKNTSGNIRSISPNTDIEEKKKKWLSTIKGKETTNLKNGIDNKSLKSTALSFFKEKNIYNEENLIILNFFCKEKLDDYLVNDEVIEFLQKSFFLYEYFINEEKCKKINKKEFIENICECCRRIFLKNIIKYEKQILNFLLKNLINFINKYSFFSIYRSLYNIYHYQNKSYKRPREYKDDKFQFLLNIVQRKINGEILLINNNKFNWDDVFLLDENDEKEIKEYFSDIMINTTYANCNNIRLLSNVGEEYVKEKEKGKIDQTISRISKKKTEEIITKKPQSGKKKGTILKNIENHKDDESKTNPEFAEMDCLEKELSCFYMYTYFKSCFDNISFYLIEKFIESYYTNHSKESIYKELFLFLFLIYKNKMHNVVDGMLTNTINDLIKTNNTEVKKKKKLLNHEVELINRNTYVTDYLFYFELLINIITFQNLQYENNYEHYIHMLKLLQENDEIQELFISSFFFILISTEDGNIRDMILTNFVKYYSKKHHIVAKYVMHIRMVFSLIYNMENQHVIYNHATFNNLPINHFSNLQSNNSDKKEKRNGIEMIMRHEYLSFVSDNIHIDKYICSFIKKLYDIISRSSTENFCRATNMYFHIYDNIFNKIINTIYENEMNLKDESFEICKNILRPFLFLYIELFDKIMENFKEKIFNERAMLSFSFIKKYLFKNLYEKTFLQKDLFYVIYQLYFLLYSLKYNFLNFLTTLITTKRKVSHHLECFLKLKIQNYNNLLRKSVECIEAGDNALHDISNSEVVSDLKGNRDKDSDSSSYDYQNGTCTDDESEYDPTRTQNKYAQMKTGQNKTEQRKKQKEKEIEKEKEEKSKNRAHLKRDNSENNKSSDEDISEKKDYPSGSKNNSSHDLIGDNVEDAEGNNIPNASTEEREKNNIINFFQKNYWTLKYFEGNTRNTLDEYCVSDFNVSLEIKETPKLKKHSISSNHSDKRCKNAEDMKNVEGIDGESNMIVNNINGSRDEKLKFVKKLNSFFNRKKEIDEVINDLFLNNKDNVYSKILKSNLEIIKELGNIRMNILYPIFNASLVFLFDDFYFFIIQNIKLVIEEKEKKFSRHKIFLNISFILLHTFAKDVKIEKYLVSIFYILKLALNKLKKLKIVEQVKTHSNSSGSGRYSGSRSSRGSSRSNNNKNDNSSSNNNNSSSNNNNSSSNSYNSTNEVYDKNAKKFENRVKYYSLRTDKDVIKVNSSELKEGNEKNIESVSCEHEGAIGTLVWAEEKIKLHQNIFYIFLKLLQNILKANNLHYNFKFIIYDILFSDYSNKRIIFSCLKCILDREKLEEVYTYSLEVLNGKKMDMTQFEVGEVERGEMGKKAVKEAVKEAEKESDKKADKKAVQKADKKAVKKSVNGADKTDEEITSHGQAQIEKERKTSKDPCLTEVMKNENSIINKPKTNAGICTPSYLSHILSNRKHFTVDFFEPKLMNNLNVSSLYINLIILYFIFTQKNKNNHKSDLYNRCIKLNIDNYHKITNKLICLLYSKGHQNAYYERYLKYFCLKIFKRIYNTFSIKEANMYIKHIKNSNNENAIFEDNKLNDIKCLKDQLMDLFEFLANCEIKNYFTKKNGNKMNSDEYKFFFLKNLSCNDYILKSDNFSIMISCLFFLFNCKYENITFYKIIYIILNEKNENKNYILKKMISSVKKFFRLTGVYNYVKKESKTNNIRLPRDVTNHSVLLYIIRTTVILLLLMDNNSINKPTHVQEENYITYPNFINYYIKKKTIRNYYTQLNFLLFRIFYNEKNLPHFFKIFFSTLYVIAFKSLNQNNFYFFEKIFNHKNNTESMRVDNTRKKEHCNDVKENQPNGNTDKSMELLLDETSIRLSENSKTQSSCKSNNLVKKNNEHMGEEEKNKSNQTGYEKNNGSKTKVVRKNVQTKRKYMKDDSSEEDQEDRSFTSDETRKNYRSILRSRTVQTRNKLGINYQDEKKKILNNKSDKKYITIDDSSSSNSTSDSDVSFKITTKRNTKKNSDANNYSGTTCGKRKEASSSNSENTTNEKKDQGANSKSNIQIDEKKIKIRMDDSEKGPFLKQPINKGKHVKMEVLYEIDAKEELEILDENGTSANGGEPVGVTTGSKNNLTENFIFNGSLSIKILNHFLLLCKGFHEDLELKIYNGIIASLKENENDKEKLKNLFKLEFSEEDKNSMKYMKKLQLLRIIQTKITFLSFIKDNLEKRKSLISRMSELNLNIFKNKSMFYIELDLI
ncbi:hypothetical protein, conserved [Plasmodium gonderi]|uniref:Uncharacterized protein n=1 Tax=Plasmodium gonderi TaxID=77519 RepID=A0A1Y1JDG4_PLAGO|nr:hypothetical protein, conserved [Plasmodium gonderi]GAW80559.1 hypothetical protein, conserved [Plasmodium gonderi]